jgi:predicted phage terminase large subunit-like protein
MECKIVSREESDFRREWLRFYTDVPGGYSDMYIVMSIDPVPPPTEKEIAKGFSGKDYEAFAVVGYKDGGYYLLDYKTNRGHTPEWTIMTFFELVYKWHPKKTRIETVAYQKTLEWLIKKAMESRRQYSVVEPWRDKRSKRDRIVDVLSGPASNYKLFVRPEHTEFISQFTDYPNVQHDDVLDAVSIAMDGVTTISLSDDDWEAISPYSKELDYVPGAP